MSNEYLKQGFSNPPNPSLEVEPDSPVVHDGHGSFSHFDRVVLAFVLAVVALILLTILSGDRVGVTLVRVAPLGTARSTSPVLIQFSEAMDRDSVSERLKFEPALQGEVSWSGTTLSFHPAKALDPGSRYTVVLEKGARSEQGREVLSEYRYDFTVARPRIAYLAPADNAPQNIWMVSQDDPANPQQVTNSPSGIEDFGVSPDGTQIAFSERNSNTGTADIKLINLETGALTQLTNCVDADCRTPIWRPDGRMIAYERVDYNTGLNSVGSSPTRVWLLDLTTTPASTRPLFSDLQVLGYSPQWSQDGQRIAVYNRDEGILVYDFATNNIAAIPSRASNGGGLSPDGTRVAFPELIMGESQEPRSYLRIADLGNQTLTNLTEPDEPLRDELTTWRPDGQRIAVARRYDDERYTHGAQIYLINLEDGTAQALTEDPRYANYFFSWDPTGDQLVVQRFPELTEDGQMNGEGRPEIWTIDVATGALTLFASNAYHPRWIP